MLHGCFICLGLQLIHCLEPFSMSKRQSSSLQDLLSACSQSEYLIVRYFNTCHPFPDQWNGSTYIYFNSLFHYAKTSKSIWKRYVQIEVNKEVILLNVNKKTLRTGSVCLGRYCSWCQPAHSHIPGLSRSDSKDSTNSLVLTKADKRKMGQCYLLPCDKNTENRNKHHLRNL